MVLSVPHVRSRGTNGDPVTGGVADPPSDAVAPAAAVAGAEPAALSSRRRTLSLCVILLCVLTASIDVTITNVALPSIGADLRADTATLQWVVDAYNIVLAGLLLLGAGLADRFGRKRVYLTGYALFGLACLGAALAPTAGALVGARAVMGLGAALVLSPSLAILATIYPPEERARAIALWAVVGGVGIAVGPVLGGLLLANFWWGSVFLVNVPVVVVGVALGLAVLPESTKPDQGPLDLWGAVLSVAGLGIFLFGIIEGPQRGWASPLVAGAIMVGALLVALFVVHERRTGCPMFDVSVLARPVVAVGAGVLFLTYVGFTSMLFFVPQYLQAVQSLPIVAVGLLMVPFAAVFGLASALVPRLMSTLGVPTVVSLGLLLLGAGAFLLAVAPQLGGTPMAVGATVVCGLGVGLLITPASTITMNDLPPERAGEGSATNMVSRYVGAAMGVAAVGTVFAAVYSERIVDRLVGLDERTVTEAERSLHSALVRAGQLGGSRGDTVAEQARRAFDAGMTWAFLVVGSVCLLGCLVTVVSRRRLRAVMEGSDGPPPAQPASSAPPLTAR